MTRQELGAGQQLSLLDAPAVSDLDTCYDARERYPGQDVVESLGYCIGKIPQTTLAKGTARESVRRPLVYIYARPSVLSEVERGRVVEAARSLGSLSSRTWRDRDEAELEAGLEEGRWVRLNGEPPRRWGMGRAVTRRASKLDETTLSTWSIAFCSRADGPRKDDPWVHALAEAGEQMGLWPFRGEQLLGTSVHELVLALGLLPDGDPRDAIRPSLAMIWWAGLEPWGDAWQVALDLAISRGHAWPEAVAMLGRQPARHPVRRALTWSWQVAQAWGQWRANNVVGRLLAMPEMPTKFVGDTSPLFVGSRAASSYLLSKAYETRRPGPHFEMSVVLRDAIGMFEKARIR